MTVDLTFWKRGLAAAGLCVLAAQALLWLPAHARSTTVSDANVYQLAARRAAAGEQVYGREPRTLITDTPSGFYYPPSALVFLAPAARVSNRTWLYVCFGLAAASTWALAAALVKIGTGRTDVELSLIVGAALVLLPPVEQSLGTGNLDMVVIATTAWAFATPRFAAPLLVTAAAIKVYPGFALVAWLPRAGRRFWNEVLASVGVIVAATLINIEWKHVGEWFSICLPSMSDPALHYGNWSLSMISVSQSLQINVADTPRLARIVLSASPLVASFVAAILMRKKLVTEASMASLVAGTWFTAMCWWWRILVLLAIPAAAWYAARKRSPS